MDVLLFRGGDMDLDLDLDMDRDRDRERDRERELLLLFLLMVVVLRIERVMVGLLRVRRLINLLRVEKRRVLGKLGMV